jgi:hypothetical protein
LIQRQIEEEEDEEEFVQPKPHSNICPSVVPGLQSHIDALGGGDRLLDASARAYMEPRFGYDFSQVRVHTGERAAEAARLVNARAFTLRDHIVFGSGQYAPGIAEGQRLIAHELAHIVQPSSQIIRKSPNRRALRSPWGSLPQDARRVLLRSYPKGKSSYWIWKQGGKSAAENYNKLSRKHPAHQRAFLRVYSAMKNAGLWRYVKFMMDIFGPQKGLTRTPGIKFIPIDAVKLIGMLSSKKFCRDTIASPIAKNIASLLRGRKPILNKIGWREIVPTGTSGLHIFPGALTEVHIDDISPVAGRFGKGTCRYSMRHILTHASVDLWRLRNITLFPGMKPPTSAEPEPRQRRGVVPIAEWRF